MSADFTTDADLARQIAAAAGEILMTLRGSRLFAGAALGAAGDRVANTFIMAALASQRPADAILSEEEANDTARCAASRVWIVDPLDGTREFAEGRADWAVHVALAVDGVAVAGAVALPAKGQMFASGAADRGDRRRAGGRDRADGVGRGEGDGGRRRRRRCLSPHRRPV